MSKRTASRARGRRRALPRQVRAEAAAVGSGAPPGTTAAIAGHEARPEVDAQPEGADGGTRRAAVRPRRQREPRDARLGQYAGLGGLFNRALREHRLDSAAVRRIAGLAPHEPSEALLDLPGGLDGVWQAVEGYVIGEGMRAG